MKRGEVLTLDSNPTLRGFARHEGDVAFSGVVPGSLKMDILTPWRREEDERRYPLIVFVQGSGFTFPDIHYELPQLAQYARTGYVVATVTHRNALEGHPFPAYLNDVKTAIRFLRANAEQYHIDEEKVCVFGTSSGGNTALLVGMTGNDPHYRTVEYADMRDDVQAVVDCFGPTDLGALVEWSLERGNEGIEEMERALAGENDREKVMREMSPLLLIEQGQQYPPFLLLHGDADRVVPYKQSADMYEALRAAGADARLVRVKNADHEGAFWSEALHDVIRKFIDEILK